MGENIENSEVVKLAVDMLFVIHACEIMYEHSTLLEKVRTPSYVASLLIVLKLKASARGMGSCVLIGG